jgi:hypothetical protein
MTTTSKRSAVRRWYLKPNGYATSAFPRDRGGREYRSMHRVVLNVPRGEQVDHVDRNRLNNQRHNLRIATQTQNLGNQVARDHTSCFKGVYWQKRGAGGWVATIRDRPKDSATSGRTRARSEAAFAYDDAAARAFGAFRSPQLPSEQRGSASSGIRMKQVGGSDHASTLRSPMRRGQRFPATLPPAERFIAHALSAARCSKSAAR